MSIYEFFTKGAHDFSVGAFDELSTGVSFPTAIFIGDNAITLHDGETLERMLHTLRCRLISQGFGRIEVQVLSCRQAGDKAHARLRVTHHDRAGNPVSCAEADYVCTREPGGEWKVNLAEFIGQTDLFEPGRNFLN